jgi:hypothetical protein
MAKATKDDAFGVESLTVVTDAGYSNGGSRGVRGRWHHGLCSDQSRSE